mgnify:CR=1 FL=1
MQLFTTGFIRMLSSYIISCNFIGIIAFNKKTWRISIKLYHAQIAIYINHKIKAR